MIDWTHKPMTRQIRFRLFFNIKCKTFVSTEMLTVWKKTYNHKKAESILRQTLEVYKVQTFF